MVMTPAALLGLAAPGTKRLIMMGYFISHLLPTDELARWCRTTQRGTTTDVAA